MVDDSDSGSGSPIAALRAQGAHRREPLRFHFVDALARRAAAQGGGLRRALDARLALALADLQQRLGLGDSAPVADAAHAGLPRKPLPPGPLAVLLQDSHLGRPAPGAAATVELKAVHQFASTWARLRVDQQLVRSQTRQPDNAGPLNSQRLMLQALQQLRGLSPAYLQRLMAHADALLWLEEAGAGPAAAPGGRADGERRRKPGRRGLP